MYYLILNKNVRPALSDIKSSWRGHAHRNILIARRLPLAVHSSNVCSVVMPFVGARGPPWAPLSGREKYLDLGSHLDPSRGLPYLDSSTFSNPGTIHFLVTF